MPFDKWTREQTVVVLNLYCKIPFNKVSNNHPDIIRVAKIIGRSINSVKMKIGNFGSFDPELKKRGIVGLANSSQLDKEVWDEFNSNWGKLAYESELLVAKFSHKTVEELSEIDIQDLPKGKVRERLVKTRVNQNFFRATILSSYDSQCCVTGIAIPKLLVAGHIKAWSVDEANRTNPHNGLCLTYLHERAFDEGYFTITHDYKVKVSKHLDKFKHVMAIDDLFLKYDKKSITLPNRFLPKKEFLDYHYEITFKK